VDSGAIHTALQTLLEYLAFANVITGALMSHKFLGLLLNVESPVVVVLRSVSILRGLERDII